MGDGCYLLEAGFLQGQLRAKFRTSEIYCTNALIILVLGEGDHCRT